MVNCYLSTHVLLISTYIFCTKSYYTTIISYIFNMLYTRMLLFNRVDECIENDIGITILQIVINK